MLYSCDSVIRMEDLIGLVFVDLTSEKMSDSPGTIVRKGIFFLNAWSFESIAISRPNWKSSSTNTILQLYCSNPEFKPLIMKNFLSFVLTPLILLVSLTSLQAQDEEFGLASYYSDEFNGRKTAYGDTYDKEKLTTAHKKHPYGTILKVTRLDNNKSVTVKVIDKGPFIRGRVVDLSRKAAEKIDLTDVGVAEVKVEVVSKVSKATPAEAIVSTPKTVIPKDRPTGFSDESTTAKIASNTSATEPEKESVNTSKETKSQAKEKEVLTAKGGEPSSTSSTNSSSASTAKPRLVGQDYTKYGLYKIVLEKPSKTGFGVQVASLSNYENVLRQVADLQAKWFDNILLSVEKGTDNPLYKIILGPFDSESQAENYKKDMAKKHKVKGFVISLDEIKY